MSEPRETTGPGGLRSVPGRCGTGLCALALVAVVGIVAACSGLSAPVRQEAHAVVEGDNPDATVEIVTSTEFTVDFPQQDPTQPPTGATVSLVSADTSVQKLPFDKTYDIHVTGRFFIRVQTPEAATDTPSVNTSVKVYVDGEQRSSVQGDLATKPLQAVFLSANGG